MGSLREADRLTQGGKAGVGAEGAMAGEFEPEPAPEGASEVILIPSEGGGVGEEDELFGGDDAPTTMPHENDEGNEEYKLQLINPSPERFVHLVTQCQFRVSEGHGEAIYQIGVEDDGTVRGITQEQLDASIETLKLMAAEIDADATVIRERDGISGRVAEVLVRAKPQPGGASVDIRISVAGNVDSGKSTLIGVFTGTGKLDNGNGGARSQVFMHKHEMESGRTSAVSQQIMGFTSTGRVTNHKDIDLERSLTWAEIVREAAKVITFFDLAGHEKYLKTTVAGMIGPSPDYCMLMLGANMGVQRMTKEHLGLAVNLALPSFVVITKIDISPDHVKQQTLQVITRILKSGAAGRKMPMVVKTEDDVVTAAREVGNKKMVPIFFVSNVTGEGIDMLKQFLNLLPSAPKWEKKLSKPAEFQIDESFHITGIGTVVSGTVTAGRLSVNDEMLFGPDSLGAFQKVTFKGIHNKRVPVETAQAGQSCSFAVKKIKRNQVRKGQLLIHPSVKPKSSWTFTAEILILYHSTSVQLNYQPVVHIGTVRQAARLTSMTGKRVLRTGERATCHFTFMYRPEYIKPGARLLFREGRTKGVGKLMSINEDGLGPQPRVQTEAELEAKHAEVLGRMTGVGMLKPKADTSDSSDKSPVSPLALPLSVEETATDAKARAARQMQLESDWAASVGEKGLGHGNARKKLNAAIIEDQESYPKQAKPTPVTPQKPARRTAWGESSPGSKNATATRRAGSPASTPPKNPHDGKANAIDPSEAEKRRLKNLKKKAAQKRKKAMLKASEAGTEAALEGVSIVTQG